MPSLPQRAPKLMAAGLAVSMVFGVLAVTAPQNTWTQTASAVTATGGSGLYKGNINWFEWAADKDVAIKNGAYTNEFKVGSQTVRVTCTASNITGSIKSYKPGGWRGDALDNLYNVGGDGMKNTMVIGLANSIDRSTVSLNVSCHAALIENGRSTNIPLQGLVIADAESSSNRWEEPNREYIEVVTATAPAWRIIETSRSSSCGTGVEAILSDLGKTLRLRADGSECSSSSSSGDGPMAISFMEGVTSADVEFKGGGTSAVALGVVLSTDYGDAPQSYGAAGALYTPSWNGGVLPAPTRPDRTTTTNVFGWSFTNATLDTSKTYPILGSTITAEGSSLFSANADADSDDALTGVTIPAIDPTAETYTLTGVKCTAATAGYPVAGWIDWNLNGVFDAAEKSAEAACPIVSAPTKTVNLTWAVPADANAKSSADSTFMRLRVGGTADKGMLAATGMTTTGEVEDYKISRLVPQLKVEKSSNFADGATWVNGRTVRYTVKVTNTKGSAFPNSRPAVVSDDLSLLSDYVDSIQLVAPTDGSTLTIDPSGKTIRWSGQLSPGTSKTFHYDVTFKDPQVPANAPGDKKLINIAWASVLADKKPGDTCAQAGLGSTMCSDVTFGMPFITAAKALSKVNGLTVEPGTAVRPGDQVLYSLTITNSGTQTGKVAYSDLLSGILDDSEISSTTPPSVVVAPANPATPGPAITAAWDVQSSPTKLLINGNLGAGKTATITYTATVKDPKDAASATGDHNLKNVLTPTDKPGTCTDPKGTFTACTENPVSVPTSVTLHKRVENVNATEPSPAKGWTLGLKAGKGTLTPGKATQVTGEDGNTRWTLKHQGVDKADLTVSEENQTGYEFKDLTCTVTHPNTNGGKPVTTTVTTSATGPTQAGSLVGVAPGSTVDCVFTNTQKSGSLTWSKVDTSAPANLLAGSEWELKGPDGGVTKIVDCQEAAEADCKGPDRDPVAGQFTLTGLPWGEYGLTETKAPAGYKRDGKTRTVIIAGDALVRSYGQIANEKRAPLTIPLTGGTGTLAFIVAGGAALGAAGLAAWTRRRRSQSLI